MKRIRIAALAVVFLVGGLVGTSVAADTKRPRVVRAATVDADGDDRADRIKLTYSERVIHRLDTDGRYPFTVAGYKVTKVGQARGTTTLIVFVKEKASPDISAHPAISYSPTRKRPVKDLVGNQAQKQTFSGTQPLDLDADGSAAADCDPSNAGVHPGAADPPEPTFADTNCDGIDGDVADAVFVAVTGIDFVGCGSMTSPCNTIQYGIDRAVVLGRQEVYIQGGYYSDGAVFLADGVSLYGGFGLNWLRGPRADGSTNTTVVGSAGVPVFPGQSETATLVASGLVSPTTVADLTLGGADGVAPGDNSYTVIVEGVAAGVLTLTHNTILAGDASDGQTGTPGANATNVSASAPMNGGRGGNGVEIQTSCDSSSKGGPGSAGVNAFPTTDGGMGGVGGEMDTDCSCCSFDFTAQGGEAGHNGEFPQAPNFGFGGSAVPANASGCGAGVASGVAADGKPGKVTNGAAGTGGSGGGLSGLWYVADAGTSGGVGQHGTGGGGGGGAGGCDDGTDAYGAGGGGGGAGGERAQSGGGAGSGGGSSFAIYLINASPTLTNNTIYRGVAGDGGAGGSGGRGQSGGLGGGPGTPQSSSPAGSGGKGAHGGHGGGGGGGAGGISVAVFATSFASVPAITGNTISAGTAGSGGVGGVSAPTAPAGDDDGNDGPAGTNGTVADLRMCASALSC